MQPKKYISHWLEKNANSDHYLFTLQNLQGLCPDLSTAAFKTLISRTVSSGLLIRVCRGVYLYEKATSANGRLLFHVASLLRSNNFNYISLETVLSDAGIISQIPMNRISIMSSGRSNVISCGNFGTIEFVHTSQRPEDIQAQLSYDETCKLWRASVAQALRDMRVTHRNTDLINWDLANEFI